MTAKFNVAGRGNSFTMAAPEKYCLSAITGAPVRMTRPLSVLLTKQTEVEAMPTQIVVIDPSPFFCEGICSWLKVNDYTTLAYIHNLQDIQGHIALFSSLAVIGPNFIEYESISICRQIARRCPTLKIILFSHYANDPFFQADAVHAGAHACLSCKATEKDCQSAITAVMAGHQLFSREVLLLAFRPIEWTEREREVLHLLAQGKTDREIADVLLLSVTTVRKHSHSILRKLGVCERREAIRRAKRLGWV